MMTLRRPVVVGSICAAWWATAAGAQPGDRDDPPGTTAAEQRETRDADETREAGELDTGSAVVPLSHLWIRPAPADTFGGESSVALRGWGEGVWSDRKGPPGADGYSERGWLLPDGHDAFRASYRGEGTFGPLTLRNIDESRLITRYPATIPEDLLGGEELRYLSQSVYASGPFAGQRGQYFVEALDEREAYRALGSDVEEVLWAPRYTLSGRWDPTPRARLFGGVQYDARFIDNAGLSTWYLESAAREQITDDVIAVVGARQQLGDAHELAATYRLTVSRDDRRARNGVAVAGHHNLDTYERWGNYPFTIRRRGIGQQLDLHWSGFTDGLLAASDAHTLTIGVQAELLRRDEDETRNGGFTYVDIAASGPDGEPLRSIDEDDRSTWLLFSSDRGDELHAKLRQRSLAAYIEDEVRVGSRVRLTPGVRLEHFGGGFEREGGAWSELTLSPRLAGEWTVTDNGPTVLYGSVARHYRQLETPMYARAAQGAAYSPLEYWDWTGNPATADLPGIGDPGWVRRASFPAFIGDIDPELTHPSVDRVVAGLNTGSPEHGLEIQARYEYRRHRDLVALYDADASVFDAKDNPDGTYEVASQSFTRPDGTEESIDFYDRRDGIAPRYLIGNPEGARRRFHQGWLRVRKSVGGLGVVSGELFYTRDIGNLDPRDGLSMEWSDPSGTINSLGPLPGYDDWAAKVGTTIYLPWRVNADVDYTYRSGTHYSRVVRVSPTNAPRTYVFDARGRGAFVHPDRHLVDARLEREVPMIGPGRWRLWISGRNLLNSGTVTGFSERARYFQSVRAIERPLEVRLGVRVDL